MPDPNSFSENLDSVLRKYGKIWIWSVLSAAVAGYSVRSVSSVSLQFTSLNGYGSRPQFAASYYLYLGFMIIPSVAILAAVWYLFLFLRHHIMPILFPAPPPYDVALDANVAPDVPHDGAQLLCRAFGAVVLAMALEIGIALVSLISRAAS